MSVREIDIHEIREEIFDLGGDRIIQRRTYRYLGVGDYPVKDFAFVYEDEKSKIVFRCIQSPTHPACWHFELPGYVLGRSEYRGMENFIPIIPRNARIAQSQTIGDPEEIRHLSEHDQLLSFSLNGWLVPNEHVRVYFEPLDNDVISPRSDFMMLSAHIVPQTRKIRIHIRLHDRYEAIAYVKELSEAEWGSDIETDRIEISYDGHVIQYLGNQFWSLAKWLNCSGKHESQVIREAKIMIEYNWICNAVDKTEGRDYEGHGL